jgi:hypothetical protein
MSEFGLGFAIHGQDHPAIQLREAYAWFGFWTTSFRVAPEGDWILITMTQLAWNESTPKWFAEYERIAADSIID